MLKFIMNKFDLILEKLPDFLKRAEEYLNELGIFEQTKLIKSDHLALRFKDIEIVDQIKDELKKENKIISSAVVNGRKILIFKLQEPIKFMDWEIDCIELPYPKENQKYPDGWEHIEFVVPSNSKNLDEFREDFKRYFSKLNIENLIKNGQYSESFPIKDSSSKELPNPTISLQKELGLTVKFHPKSIIEIVQAI